MKMKISVILLQNLFFFAKIIFGAIYDAKTSGFVDIFDPLLLSENAKSRGVIMMEQSL